MVQHGPYLAQRPIVLTWPIRLRGLAWPVPSSEAFYFDMARQAQRSSQLTKIILPPGGSNDLNVIYCTKHDPKIGSEVILLITKHNS